jgi:hypothetical protein
MRYGLVLIKIGNSRPGTVLDGISNVEGILDAYAIFGRFDLVVFIGAEDYYLLKDIATEIAGVEGVKSTETLVHGD